MNLISTMMINFVILAITSTECSVVSKKLSAVYTFVDLQNVYKEFWNKFKTQPPDSKKKKLVLTSETAQNACQDIFSSSYFTDLKKEPIDVNDMKVQDELQQKYQLVFGKLFRKSRLSKVYRAIKRSQYKYTNPYIERKVSVPGHAAFEDLVFICPVRDQPTDKIVEYFVSKEYTNFTTNDNINKNVVSVYEIARFVFTEDLRQGALVIQAVAEPPARFLNLPPNQLAIDFLNREKKEHAEDPLCALSDSTKLRICTVVMNSSVYEKKINFLPLFDYVGKVCEERKIQYESSPTGDEKPINLPENEHSDGVFTVSCTGQRVDKKQEVTYYLSRGPEIGRIFVFHEIQDKKLVLDDEAMVSLKFNV